MLEIIAGVVILVVILIVLGSAFIEWLSRQTD